MRKITFEKLELNFVMFFKYK